MLVNSTNMRGQRSAQSSLRIELALQTLSAGRARGSSALAADLVARGTQAVLLPNAAPMHAQPPQALSPGDHVL
jgi:hypothetical protein